MNPIAALSSAIRNIHRLGGRAPRSEYWWVFALLIGGVIGAAYVDMTFFSEEAQHGTLYSVLNGVFIGFYIPVLCLALSVTIRRLHDLDLSAWYACIYFVPFGAGFLIMGILCSRRGSEGPNRFGLSPGYLDMFSDVEEFG